MSKISEKLMKENKKAKAVSMEDLEAPVSLSTDEKIGILLDRTSSISKQISDLRTEMGHMYQAIYDLINDQNR